MITGYNTDVEHDGVVYHVQTEDKGLDSPIVLSLVYSGGAILAAKRSGYDDLIAAGFQEEALVERLKRQHRLICAAVHAGRIEELRRLSKPQAGRPVREIVVPEAPQPDPVRPETPPETLAAPPTRVERQASKPAEQIAETPTETLTAPPTRVESQASKPAEQIAETPTETLTAPPTKVGSQASKPAEQIAAPTPAPSADAPDAALAGAMKGQPTPPEISTIGGTTAPPGEAAKQPGRSPYTVYDPRGRSRMGDVQHLPDGLRIALFGHDPDFHGGENIQLQAIVTRISNQIEAPLNGASISVKILGTTFRPVLLSLKTDPDGVMSVWTRIPAFTSGRAAIVVKATDHDLSTEARWVVHPGK